MELDDPAEGSNRHSNVLNTIANATGGRFLLNSALMKTLVKYRGFKELRVRYFKPWHGRTVDVDMKGDYLMKALIQSIQKHGLCGYNEIRFLLADTSAISTLVVLQFYVM